MKGRPRVGVSACLLGERVRYDGDHRRDAWIAGPLARLVEFVPVCPEVEIGLGIPRPTIRLERRGRGAVRLVEPASGADLTGRMERWAARRLEALEAAGLDGYVLKAGSPSCGPRGVKVWSGSPVRARRKGRGLFADALLRRWPELPVEDETRLEDPAARKAFLDRVLARHRARTAAGAKDAAPPEESAMPSTWLVKTDPDSFSFADLRREGTTRWEGVSNALALRHLRAMEAGDEVLVYETGKARAIVGTATVSRGPYPDPEAGDPRRVVVDLRAGKTLPAPVTLAAIRGIAAWRESPLVRMGRLSVLPVTPEQRDRVLA